MALARLQFGNEKLSFGKEERSDKYFISLISTTPGTKEFAFYTTGDDLYEMRMIFEAKAREIMDLKPTEDLLLKYK